MEICVDSVISAINAECGGATRVELCSNLAEGGITPSLGLFKILKSRVNIPVFVMVRPRAGDFLYTEEEFLVMTEEIKIFQENNADGFVFGILTREGSVDKPRCKELLDLCKPFPVTFHRAFDLVNNYTEALEDIIHLGFQRILTSGLEQTCLEGLPILKQLIEQAKGRIIIVPGGGINERNLERILCGSGAKEFHCSARKTVPSNMINNNERIHMGAAYYPPETSIKVASEKLVSNLMSTRFKTVENV